MGRKERKATRSTESKRNRYIDSGGRKCSSERERREGTVPKYQRGRGEEKGQPEQPAKLYGHPRPCVVREVEGCKFLRQVLNPSRRWPKNRRDQMLQLSITSVMACVDGSTIDGEVAGSVSRSCDVAAFVAEAVDEVPFVLDDWLGLSVFGTLAVDDEAPDCECPASAILVFDDIVPRSTSSSSETSIT